MNKKLIFLDIDGTLTVPGHNVPPPSAQEAVQKARAAGHKVFLCSGRNCGMLSPLLQYGFDGVIASAGGYIECEGRVIYDCPMTQEQQARAIAALTRHDICCMLESKDNSYTDEKIKPLLMARVKQDGNSEMLRWREQLERELGIRPIKEYQGEPIYKIVFMCQDKESLSEPVRLLENEFAFCIQDVDAFGLINGELINRQFNKGLAVRRLCEDLQVSLEDTVAFGDSANDLEMIQTAALGVCMGNGSQQLKEAADAVCASVQEDGLYKAFAQYGLL